MYFGKTFLLTGAAALMLVACDNQDAATISQATPEPAAVEVVEIAAPDQTERLAQFFDDYFEDQLLHNPETATRLGRPEGMGEWSNLSDDGVIENVIRQQAWMTRLQSEFDYNALSTADQVSYLLFEEQTNNTIEAANFLRQGYAVTQMFPFPSSAQRVLTQFHSVSNLEEAEAYIQRLNGLEDTMQQLATVINDRAAFGTYPPDFVYPRVLGMVNSSITGAPFDDGEPSTLWADFNAKVEALDVDQATKDDLLARASEALVGPVQNGYLNVALALSEAIPLSTHEDGVWQVPNGDAFYAFRVRRMAETELSPAEVHEYGLTEVSRLQGEMQAIMTEVGFEGSLQDFFAFIMAWEENYYPNTDEGRAQFIAHATDLTNQIMEVTPQWFNLLPEAALEVRRIEEYRESVSPIAHYSSPALDGSRPGVYYANLMTMEDWPRHTIETFTYHEAVPGHHFQNALEQELTNVPDFRKHFFFSYAYGEGWGLYAEGLGQEMGFFEDPYSEFGLLTSQLWRAVRLVVDTGVHYHHWTRTEAYDYLVANTPVAEGVARSEVDRYVAWPGQALAYRMGSRRIYELRAAAQEALGDDFDIREFHDVVLGNGSVSMPVLEVLVQNYIEAKIAE